MLRNRFDFFVIGTNLAVFVICRADADPIYHESFEATIQIRSNIEPQFVIVAKDNENDYNFA